MRKIILLLLLIAAPIIASAQLKLYSSHTASQLVNSTYTSASSGAASLSVSSHTMGIPVKSSFNNEVLNYTADNYRIFLNNKIIKISYQIPSVNVLEWVKVRQRASDILDQHGLYLMNENPDLYNHIFALAYNDFVPLSSYAPVTVKLDFRYNKTSSYNAEEFSFGLESPVIHTKTLSIKK